MMMKSSTNSETTRLDLVHNVSFTTMTKGKREKKNNTDCDSNADGESEKEDDVVMEDKKEDKNKVSLFSYLCNARARLT